MKKMVPFNFIIYYYLRVKMKYVDFTLRIVIFLSKEGINKLINTQKGNKLIISNYF